MKEKSERIFYYLSTGVYGLLAAYFALILITSLAWNLIRMCLIVGSDWMVNGNYMGFFAGFVAYILYWVILKVFRLDHNLNWFKKFTHELTHTLVALVFFAKIHKFVVMERECNVYYEARVGYVPITLSPYCIPIYTLMLFPFRLAGDSSYLIIFDFLITFTYAFHLNTFVEQTSYSQKDIKGCGKALSTAFIIFAHIVVASLIVAIPNAGVLNAVKRVFWEYPVAMLTDTYAWYHDVIKYY